MLDTETHKERVFIYKELRAKVEGKHIKRINEEHQDQKSGGDIGAQGSHCGWRVRGRFAEMVRVEWVFENRSDMCS